jgi:hypothetical protein
MNPGLTPQGSGCPNTKDGTIGLRGIDVRQWAIQEAANLPAGGEALLKFVVHKELRRNGIRGLGKEILGTRNQRELGFSRGRARDRVGGAIEEVIQNENVMTRLVLGVWAANV